MKPKKNELTIQAPHRHGERAAKIRRLNALYPELSPTAIARKVGCTSQNVSQVLSSFLRHHNEIELRDFQTHKAEVYDAIQHQALESITGEKLRKASAPALMMVAGTAEDKARLIRGQATGIDVHVLLDVASILRGDGK